MVELATTHDSCGESAQSTTDPELVLVIGRWDSEGRPDAGTAGLLAALGGLNASAWGVDVSDLDGDPAVADAVAALAVERDFSIVAVAGGTTAEGLAARVAASSDALLALDARAVTSGPSGLRVRRPTFGGAFDAEIEVGRSRSLVVTFDPGAVTGDRRLPVIGMLTIEPAPGPVRLIAQRQHERVAPLDKARRVVAGGRGIGGPEGFAELGELADALGAAMAASRPPCDAGWIPGHHQVGITGARVAPELYVAVGISGSVQHRAGMHSARTVVAINTDPEAPMLRHADLAVIGDWREVVAGMLEELQGNRTAWSQRQAGGPTGAKQGMGDQ